MATGTNIFVVFKFRNGELDTASYNGTYARKPPARTYNTIGAAKRQWQLFHTQGYTARAGEIVYDADYGAFDIMMIDTTWTPTIQLCKKRQMVSIPNNPWHYETCWRRKDHDGIHWSGKEAKKDPDFDPEAVA